MDIDYNPGPRKDPIRQQGFFISKTHFRQQTWFVSRAPGDVSRVAGKRRVYHITYQSPKPGLPWDHYFEQAARRAREFEDAGIDLGWGGVRGSTEMASEELRRYCGGPVPSRLRTVSL